MSKIEAEVGHLGTEMKELRRGSSTNFDDDSDQFNDISPEEARGFFGEFAHVFERVLLQIEEDTLYMLILVLLLFLVYEGVKFYLTKLGLTKWLNPANWMRWVKGQLSCFGAHSSRGGGCGGCSSSSWTNCFNPCAWVFGGNHGFLGPLGVSTVHRSTRSIHDVNSPGYGEGEAVDASGIEEPFARQRQVEMQEMTARRRRSVAGPRPDYVESRAPSKAGNISPTLNSLDLELPTTNLQMDWRNPKIAPTAPPAYVPPVPVLPPVNYPSLSMNDDEPTLTSDRSPVPVCVDESLRRTFKQLRSTKI